MKNQIKTILLLGVLSSILIGFGAMLGRQWVAGFTVLALAMNLGAYFFSDKIVLRMHRAQPIEEHQAPRLYAMIRELAVRAEILAHELAHIRNRDILVSTIAAAVAGAISFIANMLQFTAIFGGSSDDDAPNPIAALALAIVAPIAATLVQLGISRSREYLADETGALLSNDPEALARALEKLERAAHVVPPVTGQPSTASLFIVNPFSGSRGLVSLFSTHPPMAERVRRLRGMTLARYAA